MTIEQKEVIALSKAEIDVIETTLDILSAIATKSKNVYTVNDADKAISAITSVYTKCIEE